MKRRASSSRTTGSRVRAKRSSSSLSSAIFSAGPGTGLAAVVGSTVDILERPCPPGGPLASAECRVAKGDTEGSDGISRQDEGGGEPGLEGRVHEYRHGRRRRRRVSAEGGEAEPVRG